MKWSDADTERARQLLKSGADDATFRSELGRTKGSAKSRMFTVKFKERISQRNRKDPNSRRPESFHVPPHVIEDAARRANAPRSITATLLGDPPVGFSALERRA